MWSLNIGLTSSILQPPEREGRSASSAVASVTSPANARLPLARSATSAADSATLLASARPELLPSAATTATNSVISPLTVPKPTRRTAATTVVRTATWRRTVRTRRAAAAAGRRDTSPETAPNALTEWGGKKAQRHLYRFVCSNKICKREKRKEKEQGEKRYEINWWKCNFLSQQFVFPKKKIFFLVL